MTNPKVETRNLQKMAEASEDKEAYQLMAKTQHYRVGVGARLPATQTPVFFVEIVVNMCPACTKVDLTFLQHALNSLNVLEQNGYTLTCQDDYSILCEKTRHRENLAGRV